MKKKTVEILFLSQHEIAKLVDINAAIHAVEAGFRETGRGRARMPAKIYLDLPEFSGDFRAMPAYLPSTGKCSLKWVNAHPENPKRGLPAVMAILILSDPKTGVPTDEIVKTYTATDKHILEHEALCARMNTWFETLEAEAEDEFEAI